MAKARAGTRERGTWPTGGRLLVDLAGALPVAKGSMRGFVVKGRAVVTDSKTPELRAFERDVRQIAGRELDRLGYPCATAQPFEALIVYYLPRPAGDFDSHGQVKIGARATPWTKPDLDKLERATLDALTGLAWDDDSRVVRVVKEKRFATAKRDIGLWFDLRVLPATMRELSEQAQLTAPRLLSVVRGGNP